MRLPNCVREPIVAQPQEAIGPLEVRERCLERARMAEHGYASNCIPICRWKTGFHSKCIHNKGRAAAHAND
eukprot:2610784-Pyramimonas_sp.AAC.1